MIEGFDIIVFTYSDWYATQSTPQHLTRIVAEKNRVLYVDVPRSFLRFLKSPDPQSAGQRYAQRLERIHDRLHVFHPPHLFLPVGRLPVWFSKICLQMNGRMLARQLEAAIAQLGFKDPLLWNFSPLHGEAVPYLKKRLTIHDICDEWANYLKHRSGRVLVDWMDRKLTREADLVFVFSDHMRQRREGLNDHMHVVLPAGDVKHYAQAALPETVVPDDLAALPKPIIGAICVVDPFRFDPVLLAYLGKARPDWSIVVLGPVQKQVDFSAVEGIPNVHMMDNRPLAQMPSYLKGFDVAIIPYALNDATRGIYPMKTQEYLAGGKPVVSPPLPACMHLSEVISFAGSHEEFARKIDEALKADTPEKIARRREVAAQNSWIQRMEQRSQHILKTLELR
ncbi:MAG: glycosyltransferase [Candidatus Hydrogenedentes bacterium]|nr:glycosyltransferase [Candidatus Hydrogenedentota bacterium]